MFRHLEGIEVVPVDNLEEVLQTAVINPPTIPVVERLKSSLEIIAPGVSASTLSG